MSYWREDSKFTIYLDEKKLNIVIKKGNLTSEKSLGFSKTNSFKWSNLLSSLSNIFNIPTIFASFWNTLSVFLTVLKFLINYFQKKLRIQIIFKLLYQLHQPI